MTKMADKKENEKGQKIDKKDKDGNSPLLVASKGGHVEVVEMLLKLGSSVNVTNNNGETALHLASKVGHEVVVKHLLKAGADPNAEDKSGTTPWHAAAAGGHASLLSLFAAERDTASGVIKRTAKELQEQLLEAVQKGAINDVKELLKLGVSLNEKNDKGETPLYLAAAYGQDRIVKLLLDAGADQWQETANGSTTLHAAAEAGLVNIMKLLTCTKQNDSSSFKAFKSKYKSVSTSDTTTDKKLECGMKDKSELKIYNANEKKDLRTANKEPKKWVDIYKKCDVENFSDSDNEDVINCEKNFRFPIIDDYFKVLFSWKEDEQNFENKRQALEKFVDHASRVDDMDKKLEGKDGTLTLLHLAAACRAEETLKRLLMRKANVNVKTKEGLTSLMMAVAGGSLEIVKSLIEFGADPNEKDDEGKTGLHYAMLRNSLPVIDYLLSVSVDPNAKDTNGNTPLHFACMLHENASVIIALLNAGADISIKNKDNLIPAVFIKDSWLLSFLLPRGYSVVDRSFDFFPPPIFF